MNELTKKWGRMGAIILAVSFVFPIIAEAGDVSGQVTFKGNRRKASRKEVKMNADPKCAAVHGDKKIGTEDYMISKSGLVKNVLVYVSEGVSGKHDPPSEPAVIDQQGCLYVPHAVALMVNQELEIKNSDNLLHNIHCLAEENPEFNFAQPAPGSRMKTFRKEEVGVKFKCDVHPWMSAFIHVLSHPYFAITEKDGTYSIPDLPAGKYTISAWHEKLGEVSQEVEVTDGGAEGVNFTLSNE